MDTKSIGVFFLLLILLAISWILYQSLLFFYGQYLLDYRHYIIDQEYQEKVLHTKFNDKLPILYVPEQFVAILNNDLNELMEPLDQLERMDIIDILSRNYNVFLYLSKINRDAKNISDYCKVINSKEYSICFVVNGLPPTQVLKHITCNNGKYTFMTYDHNKWYKGEDDE